MVDMGMTKELRALVFDIETAPAQAYIWNPQVRWVPDSMMITPPFMLMWSAVWLDGSPMMWDAIKPEEVPDQDDSRIVESIAELIREADIVIAHNGDKFDIPWVRGRLWKHQLEPLGPVQSIDTLKLAKRDFAQLHNNLNALIGVQLQREKIRTDFSWWKNIMESEDKQRHIDRMLKYCKKDTKDLRDLFKTMVPHVQSLPRLVTSSDNVCPTCGSGNLTPRGYRETRTLSYRQFSCGSCGRYCSVKTRMPGSEGGNANPNVAT